MAFNDFSEILSAEMILDESVPWLYAGIAVKSSIIITVITAAGKGLQLKFFRKIDLVVVVF